MKIDRPALCSALVGLCLLFGAQTASAVEIIPINGVNAAGSIYDQSFDSVYGDDLFSGTVPTVNDFEGNIFPATEGARALLMRVVPEGGPAGTAGGSQIGFDISFLVLAGDEVKFDFLVRDIESVYNVHIQIDAVIADPNTFDPIYPDKIVFVSRDTTDGNSDDWEAISQTMPVAGLLFLTVLADETVPGEFPLFFSPTIAIDNFHIVRASSVPIPAPVILLTGALATLLGVRRRHA